MTDRLSLKNSIAVELEDLFALQGIESFELFDRGYLCQNYTFASGGKKYFLKQYRKQMSRTVHDIKFAERYFSDQGIPVIMPIKDRLDQHAFLFGGTWFSLFPFVEAKEPTTNMFSETFLNSFGQTLARMHLYGMGVLDNQFPRLVLWDPGVFESEYAGLKHAVERKINPTKMDYVALDNLSKQARFVKKNRFTPSQIRVPFTFFLHGDYTYRNVFINESDQISHVYDFEKTCRGPRSYELIRSLLLSCFDDGWKEKNLQQAQVFFQAYHKIFPMSEQEFLMGAQLYQVHYMHTTWLESKIILEDSQRYATIFNSVSERLEHMDHGYMEIMSAIYNH